MALLVLLPKFYDLSLGKVIINRATRLKVQKRRVVIFINITCCGGGGWFSYA